MDFKDNIEFLAQANSRTCHPKHSVDEINQMLPYFRLERYNGNYNISAFNYEKHDNAPRMPYVLNYLSTNVFPFVKGDLSGYYNIQLHDTYTYLNDNIDYKDVLCFGKRKGDKNPVMIPDCYMLGDWCGKYQGWMDGNIQDPLLWKDKVSKIVFAGTTTGSRDPKTNERIQTCVWARDKPECEFYITKIAQIEPQKILKEVPEFRYIYRPPMPMSEQMRYRYQLVINGNTCRWNPDVYFTNTLAMHFPSDDMLWYSPLLQDGREFVNVSKETMMSTYKYYECNPQEAEFIVTNAKLTARRLFRQEVCQQYTISLFNHIADNKS